ncbi:MAG: type II toxin-antitoxin system prevent-host-death family antitoxin [Janthinobacterium lividum]
MVAISLDEARADIAGLLDCVEQGEDVLITRAVPPKAEMPEDATMKEALRKLIELRNSIPPWSAPSADLLRELRDKGY